MERENFYLLLEISIDPPEEDTDKIEKAIKSKQTLWSRLRNHPTKGLIAKQYISLLPEIRRVMSDPELRAKEAENAKTNMAVSQDEKFSEIDRHIEIRMSKGYISEKEIVKLADMHSVGKEDIKKRIKLKLEQKFSEIDKKINARSAKGYITEKEIISLSKEYVVKAEDIRKRVHCPIKNEILMSSSKARPLEKAIEKTIKDNLKIIGKASLYDFLDLPVDADLKTLQSKAREKENQLLKISKKDAFVTASNILSGHCITIFKTDESRQSYDISLTGKHLSALNSNIDVAGMDGNIKAVYFETLVKNAVELGMDKDDAIEYITDYCRKKKWTIQSTKKTSSMFRYGSVISAVILFALCAVFGVYFKNKWNIKNEYKSLLITVDNQQDYKKKIQILNDFVNSHKTHLLADDAIKRIKEIQNIIDEKEYKTYDENTNSLISEKKYKEAIKNWEKYLNTYPKNAFAVKAKQKIKLLYDLIDENDFKKLAVVTNLDVDERLDAYTKYLKKHPEGMYVSNVTHFIEKIAEEYYIFLKRKISLSEENEDWKDAMVLCDKYIDVYGHGKRADELKKKRERFRNILWENETLSRIIKKSEDMGNNFKEAKQLFLDFLKAYPDSHVKDKIEVELARLDKMEKKFMLDAKKTQARLLINKVNSRFIENKEGTVKDKHTGLTWCLIDSMADIGYCFDYESAISYVKSLKTGGYSDWRLPTSDEIARIYKTRPFFPQKESAQWYWTSKSYSRYSGGWSKIVDTVTSTNELEWKKIQKDSRDCGAVRAVRP